MGSRSSTALRNGRTDSASTCSTLLRVLPTNLLEVHQCAKKRSSRRAPASAQWNEDSSVRTMPSGVHVIRAPAIEEGLQDATVLVGGRILLKITYEAHPPPTVRWTRAGRELKNDGRTSISSNDHQSCLLLQDITADDSGKYDVCVENQFGTDADYASVSVEGPPDPPSGKPNAVSDGENVSVCWSSSPYDGGCKISGYTIEYSLAGSEVWETACEDCHSLRYSMRGLLPGARYLFRVRAINVHGSSLPSQESDVLQMEEESEDSSFEPRLVQLETGPEFKQGYEIHETLGKGRFGIVHKVIERKSKRKFAAKFIRCRSAKDKEKVKEEISIMNQLRHPKLLQLAAAFDHGKEMIMIMEYISGGELFERVVADDFTLTEKDCILFMKQICEGVAYMHSQGIVHLDLKPENIMCSTRTSHEIKIIDFGLAKKLNPDQPVRVLFGTPEFIPPEIINYEPISVASDMWSLGVICYVLLSGLSPFMGENDAETFANITRADYDFEDEAFDAVSQNARDFIGRLLNKRKEDRMSAVESLHHSWLDLESHKNTVIISTDKLKKFIIRRKWQKTGNAIRALGRMATLSANRRNSTASNAVLPNRTIIDQNLSVISSEEDEDRPKNALSNKKQVRHRNFSERSDSGISDCTILQANNSTLSAPTERENVHSIEKRVQSLSSQSNDFKKNANVLKPKIHLENNDVANHVAKFTINQNNTSISDRNTPIKQGKCNIVPQNSLKPSQNPSVANTIRKFNQLDRQALQESKDVLNNKNVYPASPLLLRKAQPFIKAEQDAKRNNHLDIKTQMLPSKIAPLSVKNIKSKFENPKEPSTKSECFAKASEFWSKHA